jgi:histidyl-tRNA synthetase
VIQAPKGTFDVLPDDFARRELVEEHIKKILGAAGYRRIETPASAAPELFSRGVGEATDIVQKEMYTFDDGGGRSLTLRPEGTAPVCRAYIEHGMHKLPQPVKLWYLSSFFRAEAPQRGRYRQFWQVGAEAIGSAAPETDAELIVLLADLLESLGVKETRLHLSSLGSPETRAEYRAELTAYLRANEAGLSAEVRSRIDLNPMRAFDATDPTTRETMKDAPQLLDRISPEDAEHFAAVRTLLDDAGIRYELDPTLVRGLDYYTRTLFEFSSDALGAQSGVAGGGRYDRLIEQLDGPPTAASGWAAGIERMLLAAGEFPTAPSLVDLFVALAEPEAGRTAFDLTREARRAGLQAQLELAGRSLKGQLRYADRIGARYVAIVGNGAGEPRVSLKDMQSGEQRDTDVQNVIPTILRGSRL